MIDHQSEPGAWAESLCFPSSIRVLGADEACRLHPLPGPVAHCGAVDLGNGSTAPALGVCVSHAVRSTPQGGA